jgi:hypothetical protein
MSIKELIKLPLTKEEVEVLVSSLEMSKGIKRFAGMPDKEDESIHNEVLFKLRTILMEELIRNKDN